MKYVSESVGKQNYYYCLKDFVLESYTQLLLFFSHILNYIYLKL